MDAQQTDTSPYDDGSNEVARNPSLLRVPEAAKLLAIGTRLLWSLTNSGQIPCVRIGRAVRYDPADLQRWIEKAKGPRSGR